MHVQGLQNNLVSVILLVQELLISGPSFEILLLKALKIKVVIVLALRRPLLKKILRSLRSLLICLHSYHN